MIHLVVHTTHYRKGSEQFKIIAKTLADELAETHPNEEVWLKPIYGKKDLTLLFSDVIAAGKEIKSYHFVGHSGMYGPMYGSVEYPEQYSPYELRNLRIPFAPDGEAYFHCCRSARWFAPFFAREKNVTTYGYHYYTAFTASKDKYKRIHSSTTKMYAIGCHGKKSHGYMGSVKKYFGGDVLEKMKRFDPNQESIDTTYNKVAHLYDAVFQDIKVREDEWAWITSKFPKGNKVDVLDIGCGNGALLQSLSPMINSGVGIDLSTALIDKAKENNQNVENLSFQTINGPKIPLENQSVDVVISMLSFRYLDWDPIMDEIRRVLKPDGKVLILDMVTVPVKWYEYPKLISHKLKQKQQLKKYPDFASNLKKLVSHPDWKHMLAYNPIRSEHEMKWYLESRFPGQKAEKINVGFHSCILAFDSGDISNIQEIKLTYP